MAGALPASQRENDTPLVHTLIGGRQVARLLYSGIFLQKLHDHIWPVAHLRPAKHCIGILTTPRKMDLRVLLLVLLGASSAAASAPCDMCGYNCDDACNCGSCNAAPGCQSKENCLGSCNSGGNAM